MSTHPEKLRCMALSGTISIPPRFPDIATISFEKGDAPSDPVLIVATQRLSPKLTLRRSFRAEDVCSVFVPASETQVDYEKGAWLHDVELADKVQSMTNKGAIRGILYVREHAQSLLEMDAGMTAAESAEFYPPLPEDRSVNHYNMEPIAIPCQ
ncbi:hypothetical protein [Rhodopirellula halodulae]|uniref:hypothetical protein n=1 Tax=Rhodopirellula halodulae TaxID=2894198 RepID=UPI001E333444|nr:hypothetical protein [Rhodopirellula sp. JC737]MCC9658449.1 hypothetical protein [Rhodopirellula sp. JC737]